MFWQEPVEPNEAVRTNTLPIVNTSEASRGIAARFSRAIANLAGRLTVITRSPARTVAPSGWARGPTTRDSSPRSIRRSTYWWVPIPYPGEPARRCGEFVAFVEDPLYRFGCRLGAVDGDGRRLGIQKNDRSCGGTILRCTTGAVPGRSILDTLLNGRHRTGV
jgi:hypothetical protein